MRSSFQNLAISIHHSFHTYTRGGTTATAAAFSLAARPTISPQRCFHRTPECRLPRKRNFFTSNVLLQQDSSGPHVQEPPGHQAQQNQPKAAETSGPGVGGGNSSRSTKVPKRPKARVAGGKNPLRLVAIKAQQQPTISSRKPRRTEEAEDDDGSASVVTAVCVAEGFSMDAVTRILSSHGFSLDPDGTGFDSHEVVHARGVSQGDIFVFPSGTVVTWGLPPDVADSLATQTLLPAAEEPHVARRETEDLDFAVDRDRETSAMKGDDTVVLGTRRDSRLDTTLAQIAFSSGLAQSTKLAVLEASLTGYFESMRRIPENLSRGSDVRLTRGFILQKTGELLTLRAQLNHYSELTDSLPDIFWESRSSAINLESYFDQVGKALDVRVRIRTLNEKMDYAQEIASVLREMSSEKHSTRLEWIIIVLIAIEVLFELRHIYNEQRGAGFSHPRRSSSLPAAAPPGDRLMKPKQP